MRALYFTLCIVAITALPPRQYKRPIERKLELTTEAKIEPKETKEPEKKIDETKEPANKKETLEKDVPRAYYENQSVNVVSTTTTTIIEEEKLMPQVSYAPQVSIGTPQVNIKPVMKNKAPATNTKQMMEMDDDGKTNKYTVNVYVNFPDEHEDHEYHEHDDDYYDDCYKGRCWGRVRCKEGQISIKGVCQDRT